MGTRRAFGFLLPLLLLSCDAAPGAGGRDPAGAPRVNQQGIAFGEPSALRAVVSVERDTGGELVLCSGSLLTPELVLTAAHCVTESPRQGACQELTLGPTVPAAQLRISTVDDLTRSPDETWTFYGAEEIVLLSGTSQSLCNADLALVLLTAAVPAEVATPLLLQAEPAATGQVVTALGYGAGHPSGASERRRRQSQPLAVACAAADCAATSLMGWAGASGLGAPSVGSHEFITAPGPCPGDSGGPALRDGRLVGVLSRGYEDCTAPVFGLDREAVVLGLRALADSGKIVLPLWAEASPPAASPSAGASAGGAGGEPEVTVPPNEGGAPAAPPRKPSSSGEAPPSGCAQTPSSTARSLSTPRWLALLALAAASLFRRRPPLRRLPLRRLPLRKLHLRGLPPRRPHPARQPRGALPPYPSRVLTPSRRAL